LINLAISRNANLSLKAKYSRSPLFFARTTTLVQILLENGVSVYSTDDNGMSALTQAIKFGKLDLVKFHLDNSPNIGPRSQFVHGRNLFHYLDSGKYKKEFRTQPATSSRSENWKLPRYLLKSGLGGGFDTMENRWSHDVSESIITKNISETVEILLDRVLYINGIHAMDNTPLSIAIEKGDNIVARILLERGASLKDANIQQHHFWAKF
jgi:ankyrin repeat protein